MKNAIEKIAEFNRFGSVLGLERMNSLLSRLGNPEKELKVIHVAGTNGKGSVCRFLTKALKANGYKVGLYSSPFLEVFNERIEFDGENISDDDLERSTELVLSKVSEMVKDGEDSPTEFEVVTAVAIIYFKQKNADLVVLEVGLGGRGDSTNVIEKPLVSVITSISFDHMDRLGNTIAEIAGEKAGIIKENVPVISNVSDIEAARVIAKTAYEKNAVLYDVSRCKYSIKNSDIGGSVFDSIILDEAYCDVAISMVGKHQVANAITALATIELLRKKGIIKVERTKLYKGICEGINRGRFEVMSREPFYIIDGAHNEAGMKAFVETVNEHLGNKKLVTVVGMLKDKETDKILGILKELPGDYIATEPDNIRKLDKEDLRDSMATQGINVIDCLLPKDAINKVKEIEKNYEGILFVGSLYLIGEIRRILNGY
ncbi:MAG: folylpolyglutamate synthase/dihydrofolate synthase family protein [Anaerovoracaceae bacterium]